MDNDTFNSAKDIIKHWYAVTTVGIIFIVIGILVIATPESAFISLAILFSIAFLITGILEIISSISFLNNLDGWEKSLAAGILDVIIGLIIPMQPEISIFVLQLLVGFVVLYRSIMGITWSIGMKNYDVPGWGWLLFISILGGILSFLILWKPAFLEMTIALLTGFALIMVGIFYIYFSLTIKKLKSN